MDRFLEGKTALVTGASRGLGRAIAEDLAALGALVAINYASNDDAARETLAAIESKGGKAFLIKNAQGSYEAAEELTAALDRELMARTGNTALDILVNNAGGGPVANIDATTPELFEQIFSDNLRGPFYVTKLLKSRLRAGGRVIFVSSLGARTALPDYVVYAISKRAVETFTVVMAKELGPNNITVNCISPGLIASDANADIRADEGTRTYLEQSTPLRRLGVPSDLSGVVVSLVSPNMGYVTGQIIEVTGGMSL
ncbi:SDR family NAD(P)-dependent oxidoreductase [Sphingomonas sp. LaA6.9]|uniref:SDR family NAD(P)-dependent oxidoreductase n=1 Tax=Sphingomonas sp. LaA6.9 TaxID=2919914 RepID=UPI001F4F3886|nr:SDR family oxidoreductase [Sphingomonas sp. LaA6.9]MCJ8156570.1 SDR family oxidoreductase [Sphingomonas sp. LaA6.9]